MRNPSLPSLAGPSIRDTRASSNHSVFDHSQNVFGSFSRDSNLSSLGVSNLADINVSHRAIDNTYKQDILSVSAGLGSDINAISNSFSGIGDFGKDILNTDFSFQSDWSSFDDLAGSPISSLNDDYNYGSSTTKVDFTDALSYWEAYEASRDIYNDKIELEDLWGDNTVDTSKSFEDVYFKNMPNSAKDYTARAQGLYEKFGGEDLKIDVMDSVFKVTVDRDMTVWDGLAVVGTSLIGLTLGAPAALVAGMAIKDINSMQQDIYSVGFGTKIDREDFQFSSIAEFADITSRLLGDADGIDTDTAFAISLAEGAYTLVSAGMALASGLSGLQYLNKMSGIQTALFAYGSIQVVNTFIDANKSMSDLLGSSGNFIGDVYGAYEGGIGGSLSDEEVQSYLRMLDELNMKIGSIRDIATAHSAAERHEMLMARGTLLARKAQTFRFTDLSVLKYLFTDSVGVLAGSDTWNRNFGGHGGYNPMGEHFPDIFRARTQSSQYAGYYGNTVMASSERHNSQFSHYGGSSNFLENVLIGKL